MIKKIIRLFQWLDRKLDPDSSEYWLNSINNEIEDAIRKDLENDMSY